MNRPVSPSRSALAGYFDGLAARRERWVRRHGYYHRQLARIFGSGIAPGSSVLEVGSGIGQLLAALRPRRGLGIDLSPKMVEVARRNHPDLEFRVDDFEDLHLDETFDYVVMSDLVGFLYDVQGSFENLHRVCTPRTRVMITGYNYLWEPILKAGEWLGLKARQPEQNWLSQSDLRNLLDLAGFEVIRTNTGLLWPGYLPLLSTLANRYLVRLPFFRHLALVQVLIARPKRNGRMDGWMDGWKSGRMEEWKNGKLEATPSSHHPAIQPSNLPPIQPSNLPPIQPSTLPAVPSTPSYSCSVIVPARNERGNIEAAVLRTPSLGSGTELIFVEGNSTDGTAEEIQRVIARYPDRHVRFLSQGEGRGKGDAVRKGFQAARGDILMILDADLTVDPEELPKFYRALAEGQGEMIHGSRLVYPMEKQAMRFLNVLGNKFFSLAFTYLLEQRFKDTLCGTKVLFRSDYEKIAANRAYFGDFDPFGDFDLLFGAAKLNLKIVEIPVHYRERTYGTTNISRFRHGWLLLRMCLFAMRKIKFV